MSEVQQDDTAVNDFSKVWLPLTVGDYGQAVFLSAGPNSVLASSAFLEVKVDRHARWRFDP